MSTKFSLTHVVQDHYATFYDAATARPSKRDWALVVAVPIAIAVASFFAGIRIFEAGQLLAGVAILGGFMFGLLTFVFGLKMQASGDPRVPRGGRLLKLLDELFYNVAYTTLIAFLTVAAILVPLSFRSTALPAGAPLGAIWSTLTIALLAHFAMNLAMCVKRTHVAYKAYTTI